MLQTDVIGEEDQKGNGGKWKVEDIKKAKLKRKCKQPKEMKERNKIYEAQVMDLTRLDETLYKRF